MTEDERFELANEIADEYIDGTHRLDMQEALRLLDILAGSDFWPGRTSPGAGIGETDA